jgi:hypothetical protein
LKQGDALSIALLSTVLEKVIRNIETNMNGTIFNRTRQYIEYAEEVVILEDWWSASEEVATQIKEAGLVI